MSTVKTTHQIDQFKKLIDLNGDTTNFDITFKVTSQNKEPFDILVVDQTTLDNTQTLEYKRAHGEISGNIVHDKNVYQNYYLILKAEKPCQCDIEILKRELPRSPQMPLQPPQQQLPPANKPKTSWSKIAFMIILLLAGGVVVYWLMQKSKKGNATLYTPESSPRIEPKIKSVKTVESPVTLTPVNPILLRLQNLKV